MDDSTTKRCTAGGVLKATSAFSPRKASPDRLAYICHTCANAKMRAFRQAHPKRTRVLDSDRVTPEGKACSKCNTIKPLADFYASKSSTTGRSAWCIPCFKADVTVRNKRPERVVYEANYRAAHSAQGIQKNRAWYERNHEKVKADRRAYVQKYPDKVRHIKRLDKARRRGAPGKYTQAQWDMLCIWFDNQCLRCGARCQLTADHVLPVTKSGTNDIANIQPLCGSCNSRKGTHYIDYRDSDLLRAFIEFTTSM